MYAHILLAVSQRAPCSESRTVRVELWVVSKNIRWDWILKASMLVRAATWTTAWNHFTY